MIPEEKALKIGEEELLPDKEEWLEASIEYNYSGKYYWRIFRKIKTQGPVGCIYNTGFIDLHLITGEIIDSTFDMWRKEKCE